MHIQDLLVYKTSGRYFALDTAIVLFLLALDFGQALFSLGFDSIFSGLTIALVIVLPYLLPANGEKPDFTGWILGRICICAFAAALGAIFGMTIGTLLPVAFRFLPITLLIVTAMISCYVQFHGILKFRLAK